MGGPSNRPIRGMQQHFLALGLHPVVRLQSVRRGRLGGLPHLAHGIQEFMPRHELAAGISVSIAHP
jgi:hypothetical protein